MKKVLVAGAEGNVGNAIIELLRKEGYEVIALVKCPNRLRGFRSRFSDPRIRVLPYNVLTEHRSLWVELNIAVGDGSHLHGVVYAVGHCPPRETEEKMGEDEQAIYTVGLWNVVNAARSHLTGGSSLVVIGSAINKVPTECPSRLVQYDGYAAARAAQEQTVEQLRCELEGIRVHLLEPTALSTPQNLQSNDVRLVPMPEFASQVVAALDSNEVITSVVHAVC